MKFGSGMRIERTKRQPPVPKHLAPLRVGSPEHDAWVKTLKEEDYGEAWWFWCEGCNTHHQFVTKLAKGEEGPCWKFDGNLEQPSFTPSLRYLGWEDKNGKMTGRCHLVLSKGMVRYCKDCDHNLAGKTVPVQAPQ